MRTRRSTAVLGIAVAGLVAFAPVAAATATQATKTIAMSSSNTFAPTPATVTRGTVVVWRNTSFTRHTTTSNTGLWSRVVPPGATFSRTFARAGTFRYRCTLHRGMTGTVVVR